MDSLWPPRVDQEQSFQAAGGEAAGYVQKAAVKHVKDGGRIINVGSTNAERMPFAGGGAYAMSKSGLQRLVKGFARDLGPRGITINNVQPGPVNTNLPRCSRR